MGYLDNAGLTHFWSKIKAAKQDKLTGAAGQVVGFNADGAATAVQGWSNPNLLDNWYFADPINQRGQEEYTRTEYTIDRWKHECHDSSKLLITKSGLVFSEYSDIAHYFSQIIDTPPELMTGKTLTASLMFDGQLLYGTATIDEHYATWQDALYIEGDSFETIIQKMDEWTKCYFRFLIIYKEEAVDNHVTIQAAKLESGSQQTLAHQDANGNWVLNDPPPNKALELLKCQRYYQVFATQSLRPTKAEDFRPAMRITPTLGTIKIDGVTYYTADANL